MKNTLKLLLPVFALPLLCSCSLPVLSSVMEYELNSKRTSNDHSFTFKCDKAQGTMTYRFKITNKQSLDIKADYTVELGALTVTVMDDDKNEIHNGIIVENGDTVYTVSDYGYYRVEIVCDEFRGGFSFNWAK